MRNVQAFLEDYKQRLWQTEGATSEHERTQVEEQIRRVNLIRDALTTQEDFSRPIDPESFVHLLRDVASGNQAVLPVQRGDAKMEALAMDLLEHWEINDPTVQRHP